MTEHIHEAGTLQKGDMCVVSFPDGRPPWLCRVIATLPYDDSTDRNSMYECVTPHGSSLITGALWVRPADEGEAATLHGLEVEVQKGPKKPYKGLYRLPKADGTRGL